MFVHIGRFCVRHHRSVLLAWALVLLAGVGLGSQVFAHLTESNGSSRAESVRGFQLVDDASRHGPGLVAVVDGAAVDDPATRRAVTAAAREVSRVDGVTGVVTAYDVADPRLRADDGRASLMVISTTKTTDMMRSDQILTGVRAAVSGAVPGATVTVGGELAVLHEQMTAAQHDLVRGEMLALPILLLALLLVFRGFRAAVLPIVAALVTVAGALLLLLSVSGAVDLAGYAVDVVALFGLALSVDYSLLMVTRFREERAAGHGVDDAVVRTVTAAGRTIAFSALTVIAALAGLFVFADPTFTSLAIGGIATTVLALFAGLFLVPALLAGWGRTISPRAQPATASGAFGRLARRVQRRPVAVVTVCVLGLLVLATPFLSVNYGQGDPGCCRAPSTAGWSPTFSAPASRARRPTRSRSSPSGRRTIPRSSRTRPGSARCPAWPRSASTARPVRTCPSRRSFPSAERRATSPGVWSRPCGPSGPAIPPW